MMAVAPNRKNELKMSIHTGMLESLGVNMYTSIGQSLVEFIANSFDADASTVNVTIPFKAIETARKNLRKSAKTSGKDISEGIYSPLPNDVIIEIVDNGHGMTADEIEDKFLSLSRNRRKEGESKTESGKRTAMGRKGLGKLAG